jgi:hypothetical protein
MDIPDVTVMLHWSVFTLDSDAVFLLLLVDYHGFNTQITFLQFFSLHAGITCANFVLTVITMEQLVTGALIHSCHMDLYYSLDFRIICWMLIYTVHSGYIYAALLQRLLTIICALRWIAYCYIMHWAQVPVNCLVVLGQNISFLSRRQMSGPSGRLFTEWLIWADWAE